MNAAIDSPEHLSENDLEQIIDIWNRKPQKIANINIIDCPCTFSFFC